MPVADGLRDRKKALTREAIEEAALRRFVADGYDQGRVEDICADVLVSQRTFFRYFASKEDLVLGRLRGHLEEAGRHLDRRPSGEPIGDSLRSAIAGACGDYEAGPERELRRLRLVTTTPALRAGLLAVFDGFEGLVCQFAARRGAAQARLLAAAAVTAFRVGLETWRDDEARPQLTGLVLRNLDALTKGLAGASGRDYPT
ncbi:TetR family transcriptional regulator [Actinoplanes sp. CA-142083]|uniref:acyl-CoA-like ligand-binding transcription factor n=1 Tax=Actinoplanes sp. CA-142083 TaxID=3239903 RepID=UPI003D8E0FFE